VPSFSGKISFAVSGSQGRPCAKYSLVYKYSTVHLLFTLCRVLQNETTNIIIYADRKTSAFVKYKLSSKLYLIKNGAWQWSAVTDSFDYDCTFCCSV